MSQFCSRIQGRKKFEEDFSLIVSSIKKCNTISECYDKLYKLISLIPRDAGLAEKSKTIKDFAIVMDLATFKAKAIELLQEIREVNLERIVNGVNFISKTIPKNKLVFILPEERKELKEYFERELKLWSYDDKALRKVEDIEVVHNGGLNYVLDFMSGDNTGYRLENQNIFTGLQVMPVLGRNLAPVTDYLVKAVNSFDVPVIFRANIASKFLDAAQESQNEAGIRSCYADKINSVSLTICIYNKYLYHNRSGQPITHNPKIIKQLQKLHHAEICLLVAKPKFGDFDPYEIVGYNKLEYLDLALSGDQHLLWDNFSTA